VTVAVFTDRSEEKATQLYADHGYPEAQLQPETEIDEAAHQINLIIRVTEGAQKQ
jgi:outer membrane protein assembly factor BamA